MATSLSPAFAADHAPKALRVLAKPTGAICNLDCDYCFYLSKEQLYAGGSFRMSDEVLRAYIQQILAGHEQYDEVVVAFQGGEPTLMGLDFFRRTLDLERTFARPGQRIVNTVQTNATLLNNEWGEFFARHKFLVGVSIDGPRRLHDAYRVDKGGNPTFDRVMRGLRALTRHRVEWNALTTVNAANEDHGREVYEFLRDDCGARHLQFIPVVERTTPESLASLATRHGSRGPARPFYRQEGNQVTSRSTQAARYGRFMMDVFDEWVRRDVGRVYVQAFETALGHWLALEQAGLCVHAKTCGTQMAIEHNGDVYSCDHYVEPQYRLGNISEGHTLGSLARSERQHTFGQNKYDTLPRYCLECEVRFACNGGCPKDRFVVSPDGEPGLNYLCDGYRTFFSHIDRPMQIMAALLRARRTPTEVMSLIGSEVVDRTQGSGTRKGDESRLPEPAPVEERTQGGGSNDSAEPERHRAKGGQEDDTFHPAHITFVWK